MKELNLREAKFVEFYLETVKGTESAERAGYKHPAVASSKLLKKPKIQAIINQKREEMSKKAFLSKTQYIKETYDNYMKEGARDTKRKYWELLGDLLGHLPLKREGGSTMLAIFEGLHLKEEVKKRLGVEKIPEEIEKMIDDNTRELPPEVEAELREIALENPPSDIEQQSPQEES